MSKKKSVAHSKPVLREVGEQIRSRRKTLKVSAVSTAEAAGISRMTLNRIERGAASVTFGAYMSVLNVLGLDIRLVSSNMNEAQHPQTPLPDKVHVSDYPQLQQLAWQMDSSTELTPEEAANLYERNWRHVDREALSNKERDFIRKLIDAFGKGRIDV